MTRWRRRAQATDIPSETLHLGTHITHPYRAIIETANWKGCDLILMASHGRHGISAVLLIARR